MSKRQLQKKYKLDPRTGLPLYLNYPDKDGEDVAVLACITSREASLIMDERIRRVCIEIQESWTDEERERRFVGDAVVQWQTPVVETKGLDTQESYDG